MGLTIDIQEMMVEAHPMKGGDDQTSYFQNSNYQRGVIEAAKGVIFKAVAESLDIIANPNFDSSNPFRIADFGCSTGPNSFFAMQNIVEAVKLKYKSVQEPPEFHVFFNDHVNNDFNILFRSLLPLSPEYFAAGVPGSFYIRLFPKASLHFVHSSYALQWLSKVPKEVKDKNSPAWNKGRIFFTGVEKEVVKAYSAQFLRDMDTFLKVRAQELVEGGLMVIQFPGLPNDEVLYTRIAAGLICHLLGASLMDMAKLGVISEEKVDSFNVPQYYPSIKELEKVIETNNSFSIELIGTLNHPRENLPFDVETMSAEVRAGSQGMIREHFGNEIMDGLFERFTKKLQENYDVFDKEVRKDNDICVVLKRKSN